MYGYYEAGKIIGYYSLVWQDKDTCELNNLSVLPQYRHRRIGGSLLADACQKARGLGCKRINIGFVEENTVLRKWYEDKGFLHIGVRKFDFFPFTCGYMTKEL